MERKQQKKMARQIELTRGYYTLVDDEDYEWLIQWKWRHWNCTGHLQGLNRRGMIMSRPKGMRKVNGIWYLPNGQIAPSSAAKANGQVVTLMPPVINATDTDTDTDTVQDKPRHTGIKVHTHAQIMHIENKTGQRFVDNFSDDCGILIPVFMTTDRSEDWVMEHLTKIRKGA